MTSKIVTVAVLVAFVNLTIGCTSTKTTLMDGRELTESYLKDQDGPPPGKIMSVKRWDGAMIIFNEDGGVYKNSYLGQDSVIVGVVATGEVSATRVSEIEAVWVKQDETDALKTAGLIGGVGVTALVILGVAFIIALAEVFDRD